MTIECNTIHEMARSLTRFTFPFDESIIPKNGVYFLFENREYGHEGDRIVRVGTHTGENQLRARLKQHFQKENKDRSIFRKNIGRALLNRNGDAFLRWWEIDLTTKGMKFLYLDEIDLIRQKNIEALVSKVIQANFSFSVIEIKGKDQRLEIESKLISTIANCGECQPSQSWLGLYSTKEKIRKKGLWLVNELNGDAFSRNELDKLVADFKV